MCGAQNNPGMPACYNCGNALAQTFAQPQQQWAPQQQAPAQQQWAPQQQAPAQQQWEQQPAMQAAPAAGGGYGGGTASSWDQGFSYSSHGHGGGSNVVKIATISIVSLILVGGGTLTTLWAMGVIWSDADIVGEWTDDSGEKLEFKDDGTLHAEDFDQTGASIEWEVNDDKMKWSITYLAFECDDGEEIAIEWVNDGDEDCDDGEDEGASQSFIDSRSVSAMGMVMDLKFEIVEDVMFLKLVSMEMDGESFDDGADNECIAFVRRDVADSASEWQDTLESVKIPSMCDGVEGYNENSNDNTQEPGPSLYVLTTDDHTDPVDDHMGLMTLTFGNGADLDWALVQIEIIEDSIPMSCGNPGMEGYDCSATQHGGEEDQWWEKGETLIITDTGANLCDSECEVTIRIKYDGNIVMSNTLYLS